MYLTVRRLLLIVLCVLGTGVWAGAQMTAVRPVTPPRTISGADLGFQINGMDGDTPVGEVVVRINGKWVGVREAAGPRRLSSH